MRSFKRRRFARSALSLVAVLGLVLTALAWYAPQPAQAQTATITVNNHTCDVDVTTLPDLNAIAAACQGIGSGVTISAVLQTAGDPADYTYTSVTDGGGLAGFSGLPAVGTYYLYQAGTPGYSNFIAFCKVEDFLGNDIYPFYFPQLQPDIIDLQLINDGDMGYCDFFNYNPGPAPTTGSVTVNKITCPEGYDGYSGDIFDLAANCQDASQIVDFTLTDVNGATQTATTPGAVVNLATFQNVPTGAFTINEDSPPDGYGAPRVFCKNQRIVGESETSTEVAVNGYTASYEFKLGYDDVYCDWFNISFEPNYVTIVVNKYACPEGYISSDPSELAAECNEPYDPITFKLDGASTGNPGDQETGSVIPGGVRWSGLEGDTYYISEFLPQGYNQPIVFCKLISNDDQSESSLEQVPVEPTDEGYRIVRDVAEFYTLSCSWYNTSGDAYSGIYLHKLGCPDTWEESWEIQDWINSCTTVVRDAWFTLEYQNGDTDRRPINGIDVWWEQLPPGEYSVSEEQPQAWTESVIYCALGSYSSQQQGTYERLDTSDNSFSWDLNADEYIDCYWFNLPRPRPTATIDPNAPATIIIVKYTCPEAYDPLALQADPTEDCDDLTDGVEFAVVGSQNASITGITGDDEEGEVTFSGLRAGSYLLRESYPENTEAAFVWSCESDVRIFDYPFTPFARIDATGTIKISVVAGETLECSWYNVPTPEEATPEADGEVEVTINVYQCAAGANNPNACDPAGEGIGVSLSETSGGGGPIDFETDEDGVASGSVDAGEYDIDADEPICFGDSDAFTADGTLEFEEGDAVEVSIYLCG